VLTAAGRQLLPGLLRPAPPVLRRHCHVSERR
jgi:hypothetical protein